MTDLTKERLDELARTLKYSYGEFQALIAMAKRTEASERERDALRVACATISGFDDDNPNWAKWRDTKRIVRDVLIATDAALSCPNCGSISLREGWA